MATLTQSIELLKLILGQGCSPEDQRRYALMEELNQLSVASRSPHEYSPPRIQYFRSNSHGQTFSGGKQIGFSMAVVKRDYPQITWDAEAMAKRPFREAIK